MRQTLHLFSIAGVFTCNFFSAVAGVFTGNFSPAIFISIPLRYPEQKPFWLAYYARCGSSFLQRI